MSLTSIDLGLREVLADPERRQAFFRTITQDDIAEQIRALRKTRDLTQTKFAVLAGMKQSAVSRIEQAEYASWTLATLFRVAGALNARWRMILEPCEDAIKEYEDIGTEIGEAGESTASAAAGALTSIAASSQSGAAANLPFTSAASATPTFPTLVTSSCADIAPAAALGLRGARMEALYAG